MEVIDAQVHIVPEGDAHGMTADATAMVLSAHSVGGALVTTRTRRDTDNAYLLSAIQKHPNVFAAVGYVNPDAADVEEHVRACATASGIVGTRLVVLESDRDKLLGGGFARFFGAAQLHRLPLCIWAPGMLYELGSVIESYPELQVVLDHLGLAQPTRMVRRDDPPFRELPKLLALAQFPNVVVKLTAAPSLSLEQYPFSDLWPFLHRILAAYGPSRVMWGSDWTRATYPYVEGLEYLRNTGELSYSDKALVLGGSLRRVFRWGPRLQTA